MSEWLNLTGRGRQCRGLFFCGEPEGGCRDGGSGGGGSFEPNRLDAVGADGNEFHGASDDLFDGAAVLLGVVWEGVEVCDSGDIFLPAWQGAEDWFGCGEIFAAGGQAGGDLPIDLVGFADAEFREPAEDIEQSDGDGVNATDAGAVAGCDGIEPAAAAGATCYGTEFVAGDADAIADVVIEFGGEWSSADAGGVGFGDADHADDGAFRDAAAIVNTAAGAVGGGDVGEGAVIDVEQAALSPFEQDPFAVIERVEEVGGGIGDEWLDACCCGRVFGGDLIGIHLGALGIECIEDSLFEGDNFADFGGEGLFADEVTDADGV